MFFYHSNIRTKFITFGCWPHQIIIDFLSKTKNVSSVIDNQQHLTKKKKKKEEKEFSNDNRIQNVFSLFLDDDNDHDDERWPPSSKFLIFLIEKYIFISAVDAQKISPSNFFLNVFFFITAYLIIIIIIIKIHNGSSSE